MTVDGPDLAVQDLLDALAAATCVVGSDGVIVAVNQAWRSRALDRGSDPVAVGTGADYLVASRLVVPADAGTTPAGERPTGGDLSDAAQVARGLQDVLSGARASHAHTYPCCDGEVQRWITVSIAPLATPRGRGALLSHSDVTVLHRAEQALTHQARHDVLTGLANRTLLEERLTRALDDARHDGTHVAVAFVDLDHFKRVNDSHGHAGGDALLVEVADRLRGAVRETDTLARYAGDEFVAVWVGLESRAQVDPLSARLSQALEAPVLVHGSPVQVGASIGIAVASEGQSSGDLLLAADVAMYEAKRRGRGRTRVLTRELGAELRERSSTEHDLRAALAGSELALHYQPVVDLHTGRPVAVEALARWHHPRRGLLAPDAFITVAEQCGLILPLGLWALRRACADAADAAGPLADLDVAVNLSVRQLADPDVIHHVRGALDSSGLDPHRLVLEVTETAVVEDEQTAALALEELSALGVRLALDDFGTGWSSLLYLRRYPVTTIKMDRDFVAGLGRSRDDEAICASVVALAHAVGATCVAEGVETTEQATILRGYGCHRGQGFLWSPAVPLGQLSAALDACRLVPTGSGAPRRRRRRDRDPTGLADTDRIALSRRAPDRLRAGRRAARRSWRCSASGRRSAPAGRVPAAAPPRR